MRLRFQGVLLLCALAGAAQAANDPDTIRARGTLIVSVKNQGAGEVEKHRDPAHFQKRELELGIARAIATRLLGAPDKLALRMLRKPERLPAVAHGEVDLGISMLRVTPESEAQVEFSTPYYQSGLAVLQARHGPVQGKRDLAGRTFAVISRNDGDAAAMIAAVAAASGETPKVILVDNFRAGVAALEDGRAAGLLSEAVNIDVFLARHGGAWERSPLLTEDRYAVAAAKGNHALIAVVNEVLAELAASGELARMARAADLPSGGAGQGGGR